MHPIPASQARSQTPEFPPLLYFLVLGVIALLATIPFWFMPWDLQVAAAYLQLDPQTGVSSWPRELDPLWRFFYHAAPVMVGILAFGGVALAAAGLFRESWLRFRPMGLYLILTVIFGPGLLVNALGKEYAGRLRPRQVFEKVDPQAAYQPPFQFGKIGEGKSFPCGHCSVGFSFAALWLLVRRRNLWLGRLTLVGGLALGAVMGGGRIAAGAHFFSDVLWSGLMVMLAAGITYYYILRMPARWDAWAAGAEGTGARTVFRKPGARRREALVYGAISLVLLFCLLLASPMHEDFDYTRENAGEAPATVILMIDEASTQLLENADPAAPAVFAQAKVRGFGLPSNKVRWKGSLEKVDNVPTVTVTLQRTGLYTDFESGLNVTINPAKVSKVIIRQKEGSLTAETTVSIDTSAVAESVERKP